MRCPYCGSLDTQVKDSRPDGRCLGHPPPPHLPGLRRPLHDLRARAAARAVRRQALRAGGCPFDRDKLQQSVEVALRKRPVDPERVERMINGIVRQLESMGDGEVPSETVGELVMEGLKGLDDVAYVRFASVYKNFREAKDFEEILGKLAERGAGGRLPPRRAKRNARAARVMPLGAGRRLSERSGRALHAPGHRARASAISA